jgi:hypothetical protein
MGGVAREREYITKLGCEKYILYSEDYILSTAGDALMLS